MYCVRRITTAFFVLVRAQALTLKADSPGPSWLRAVHSNGDVTCSVEDECIAGNGSGSCFVSVDAFAVPSPLGSTDVGSEVDFVNTLDGSLQPLTGHFMYPPESPEKASHSFVILGRSPSSHWNLCWTPSTTDRRNVRGTGVEDYCYYVNGLCWLWASPCSGAFWCSQLNAHSSYNWFCPGGLRYASQSEFDAATPTLYANKLAFHAKCAASQLDPWNNHCDYANTFVRAEDNSFNELILVCGTAVTPNPTPNPTVPPLAGAAGGHPLAGAAGAAAGGAVAATGDPHLQNVFGERFDLMKPGMHILIHIPRGQPVEKAVLRVEADAVHVGVQCTDMYFQELNITGAWVEAKRTGGFYFNARRDVGGETMKWERFGKVDVKVAHGRTQEGTRYLNFYVKHLAMAGYAVGGLLGEDDHTEAVTPAEACVRRSLTLLQISR